MHIWDEASAQFPAIPLQALVSRHCMGGVSNRLLEDRVRVRVAGL